LQKIIGLNHLQPLDFTGFPLICPYYITPINVFDSAFLDDTIIESFTSDKKGWAKIHLGTVNKLKEQVAKNVFPSAKKKT